MKPVGQFTECIPCVIVHMLPYQKNNKENIFMFTALIVEYRKLTSFSQHDLFIA